MNAAIQELKNHFPSIQFEEIQLPKEHSLNGMLINYGPEAIYHLLQEAKAVEGEFIHSNKEDALKSEIKPLEQESEAETTSDSTEQLVVYNSQKRGFNGNAANYYVLGGLPEDLSQLEITLQLEDKQTRKRTNKRIDLLNQEEVNFFCELLSNTEGYNANFLQCDLILLTDLLIKHIDKQIEEKENNLENKKEKVLLPPSKIREAVNLLSQSDLITQIDHLVELSGVIGEENNRTLLYLCASSYLTHPLHVLVHGSSGSGKSHMINSIVECVPGEDTLDITRASSKTFYNYSQDELTNKIIVIQDWRGLDEESQYSFREAQSHKQLSSSTVVKDRFGNHKSVLKKVKTHFSSIVASTEEIYFDNMSRSIVLGVDESKEQTLRIINHQNRIRTGKFNYEESEQAKELLRNCIRVLRDKPALVINPYADKLCLPMEAKMLRRLNEQYQSFIEQVTFFYQFQRERDKDNRLITTTEDIRLATDLFFDAIVLKVDELDSSTRNFFERLKTYMKKKGQEKTFTQREIRLELNESKTQCFRYITELLKLEYIVVTDGTANRGFDYRVNYWDEIQKLKERIKSDLTQQINQL